MTGEALERLFVGRHKIFNDVLKRLLASCTGQGKHYILLVGPRGSGKTHFVSLLAHKLRTDPRHQEATRSLKIAHLNEEEWGVASFLDLVVRVLSSLASTHQSSSLRSQLDAIYTLYARNADAALAEAERTLTNFIGGDTLLLICENLFDIFEGLGEEGQKRWRSLIQENPYWTILATTPALFSGVRLQDSPFYGFFTVRNLDKLSFEAAVELLRQKATVDGRRDLSDFIGTPTGRARVRAIHHLAGGNHRVYVIMSDFLSQESLDDLVAPFMRMVDDLTPYYQDRMRQLAPQQRKVVEFLCHETRPVVVKDIAARCLMSQQTAAKQISELVRLGVVARTKRGRETFCELAEPLMRICIEVKDNRTEHLRLFVSFLREWFSTKELRHRLDDLSQAPPTERLFDRLHFSAAVHECRSDLRDPFLDALSAESKDCLERKDFKGLSEIACRLADDRGKAQDYRMCVYALRTSREYAQAISWARRGIELYPTDVKLRASLARSLLAAGLKQEAMKEIDRAISLSSATMHLSCLRGEILFELGLYGQVLENEAEVLRIDPLHEHSFFIRALAQVKLGRTSDGLREFDRFLSLSPKNDVVVSSIGSLSVALLAAGQSAEALALLDKALSLEPSNGWILCNRGTALIRLGRFEEAIENEKQLIRIEPTHAHSFLNRSYAYMGLNQLDAAERDIRRYIDLLPKDAYGYRVLASILRRGSRYSDALELLQAKLADFPDNADLELMRLKILADMGSWETALAEAAAAAEKHSGDSAIRGFLVECLVILERFDEAVGESNRFLSSVSTDEAMLVLRLESLIGLGDLAQAEGEIARLLASESVSSEKLLGPIAHFSSRGGSATAVAFLGALEGKQFSSAQYWTCRAQAEIFASATASARRSIKHAADCGAGSRELLALQSQLLSALNGISAAENEIHQALSVEADVGLSGGADLVAHCLLVVCHDRPDAFWSSLIEVRRVLEKNDKGGMLSAVLIAFLNHAVARRLFYSPIWARTVSQVDPVFASAEDSRLALEMISVMAKYLSGVDPDALLTVPLEQRNLLTNLLGGQFRSSVQQSD
ncbi:tetratricopeptide repeat protein [Myxococcaceae bacterium GXIMD 01537]